MLCSCYNCLTVAMMFFSAVCEENTVRLVVGDNALNYYNGEYDYPDEYYSKNGLARGRVEVCSEGRYVTVCYDGWDEEDASVVCRQLGFSPYGRPG